MSLIVYLTSLINRTCVHYYPDDLVHVSPLGVQYTYHRLAVYLYQDVQCV